MDKETKHWLKLYLLDILCGMLFWGIIFGLYVLIGSI
jgi:hypothetical protein